VVSLIAKSACDGMLPVAHGGVTLSEVVPEAITSVAFLKNAETTGADWPAPNRWTGAAGRRAVSVGPGKVFVIGAAVDVQGAAITDQSDAWAMMALEGPGARDVLARLCPQDLRPGVFAVGHAAQTLIGHMTATLMRTEAERYEILVFRSMAHTAVHELSTAMAMVAARG
ncbi:MAG: sarcosine oxidase subunit gamma family protein, partial [Pseudomonadota bacterium]